MNTYNYLIFKHNPETSVEKFVSESIIARAKTIGEVLSLINCSEFDQQDVSVLRFNEAEIAVVSRIDGQWVAEKLRYFDSDSSALLEVIQDQLVIQEVLFASINFYNCIKTDCLKDAYAAYKVLARDKIQTVRIIKIQLEVLFKVTLDSTDFKTVLREWWRILGEKANS